MHEPTNSEDLLWQLVFKYISYNGYHLHAAAVQVFLYSAGIFIPALLRGGIY